MVSKLSELQYLFYADCGKRIKRIDSILKCGEHGITANDYDVLYQEFDSLYGGAKAACFPELENFFFALAGYARFLKRCLPNLVSERDMRLILEGVDMVAAGESRQCDGIEENWEQLSVFVKQLSERMQRSSEGV
jgi:hypothetical protein